MDYRKERIFLSNYFIFFDNFVSVGEPTYPYLSYVLEFYLKLPFPCGYP